MYLNPEQTSEVTDEILFGTAVTVKEKAKNGFLKCITDYGYGGFIRENALCREKNCFSAQYTVTSPFCPLYQYPECRCEPYLILPRSSTIFKSAEASKNGFTAVSVNGKTLFANKKHLTPKEKLFTFHSCEHKRAQIAKTALSYLGTPYLRAGRTPAGIDCSGLCFTAYSMCGTGLYRDAEFDGRYLRKISKNELKKSDLIYYNGHVVMYLGKGYYIHSSASSGHVTINSFDKNSPLYRKELDGTQICFASSLAFYDTQSV